MRRRAADLTQHTTKQQINKMMSAQRLVCDSSGHQWDTFTTNKWYCKVCNIITTTRPPSQSLSWDWHCDGVNGYIIDTQKDEAIATINTSTIEKTADIANFIVTAVNAHDDLLEALQEMIEVFDPSGPQIGNGTVSEQEGAQRKALRKARQALQSVLKAGE